MFRVCLLMEGNTIGLGGEEKKVVVVGRGKG